MGRQRRYATYRIPFVGFACACLLFGSLAATANPETVSVQVTFVDPVAIQQGEELPEGYQAGDSAGLIIDGSEHQTSNVLVESGENNEDLTVTFH